MQMVAKLGILLTSKGGYFSYFWCMGGFELLAFKKNKNNNKKLLLFKCYNYKYFSLTFFLNNIE